MSMNPSDRLPAESHLDAPAEHRRNTRPDGGKNHARRWHARQRLKLAAAIALSLAPDVSTPAAPPSKPDLWGGKRTFAAELSAGYQPVVTRSNGRGSARIVLDLATRTINWEIEYSGLTSPATAIGLHGPAQPGTNGALIIDLGARGSKPPVRGSVVVPPGQIQYMLLGWTYVLVSTQRYPNGELRGKLDVVPPEKAAADRP